MGCWMSDGDGGNRDEQRIKRRKTQKRRAQTEKGENKDEIHRMGVKYLVKHQGKGLDVPALSLLRDIETKLSDTLTCIKILT